MPMYSGLPSAAGAAHPANGPDTCADGPAGKPCEFLAVTKQAFPRRSTMRAEGPGQSGPFCIVHCTSMNRNRGHRDRLRTKRFRDGCDATCNRRRTRPQPGHRLRLRQFSGQYVLLMVLL